MSNDAWRAPGANADGFVDYESLQSAALRLDRDAFRLAYPVPALLVVYRDEELVDDTLDPTDSAVQLLTVSISSQGILRYLNRVAFVAKRPGNMFAHLVSVGRSATNDIVIGIETVSKVHGYFVREGSGLSFSDHSSTNGSRLNGDALEPAKPARLTDGDMLQLGLEVHLQFLEPDSLYDQLTGRR
ncbi:MAG: FHA domain-containing protein [Acidobacteriota bacterium]